MSSGPFWTKGEDERLAGLWAAMVPTKRIAAIMGRPLRSVWKRRMDIGLPKRARNEELWGKIAELNKRGLNDCEIARRLKMSGGGVSGIRARLGLPVNKVPGAVFAKAYRRVCRLYDARSLREIQRAKHRSATYAEGWPPCSPRRAECLGALEAAGEATAPELSIRLGVSPRSGSTRKLLVAMLAAGWVEWTGAKRRGVMVYRLAPSVAERRRLVIERRATA